MKDTDLWLEVLESLGNPILEQPRYSSEIPTAAINLETTEILINPTFVKNLNAPIHETLKGVMAHEANHHVTAPYDLATNIIIDQEAASVSEKHANKISNYFLDVVINLDLVDRDINEISSTYRGMDLNAEIDKTLRALYIHRTDLDFGKIVRGDFDIDVLMKLDDLSYSPDMESMKFEVKEFGHAIKHLLDEKSSGFIDDINSENYSEASRKTAVIEAADHLTPDTFKKYGSLKDYYDLLSKKHTFQIKKQNTPSFNENHSEWEVGDEYSKIDIYKSKNKFLPGVTIKREKVNGKQKEKKYNDALIMLDSSGSMPPPDFKSPAVTAGFCIANHYLNNNKKVGVANFSDVCYNSSLTSNPDEIKKQLLKYQGGLTKLNSKDVLKNYDSPLDIYLITDMAISDSEKVYSHLSGLDSRVSVFNVGPDSNYVPGLKKYDVQDINRLPDVVVGDMNGI